MILPTNLNFLIVEDLISDTFLLQRQLRKISSNPEIRFVDNEISLINSLKSYIPDMVITDFNLVGMNAFDVIRITKDYNAAIAVIVITGNLKYESDSEELLKKGAEGFFFKEPVNTLNERIAPLISEIIETRKDKMKLLERERQKYDSRKSHSDFLREYEFEGQRKEDGQDLDYLPPSLFQKVLGFFRK